MTNETPAVISGGGTLKIDQTVRIHQEGVAHTAEHEDLLRRMSHRATLTPSFRRLLRQGWARCHVAAESCQLLGGKFSPWLLATLRLVFGPWRLVATGLKNKADSGPDDRSKQRRESVH